MNDLSVDDNPRKEAARPRIDYELGLLYLTNNNLKDLRLLI